MSQVERRKVRGRSYRQGHRETPGDRRGGGVGRAQRNVQTARDTVSAH